LAIGRIPIFDPKIGNWPNLCHTPSMSRKLLLIALFVLPMMFGFQNIPSGDPNARIKSVFIYNFTRYIEWPEDYKTGNFIICMYGSNQAMLNELNNMAKTKTVGTQKIEVKNVSSLDAIGKNHILYVTKDISTPVKEILSKIKGKSTLLVTEKPGNTKEGAAINFVVVESKQKFELSQTNAEKNNLKVSSSLVALAIPVGE
jgi:YfiR/HmsC-like